jgi:lysophospholipase L1-like esterase
MKKSLLLIISFLFALLFFLNCATLKTFIRREETTKLLNIKEKLLDSNQKPVIVLLGDSITEKNFHTHEKENYADYLKYFFKSINPNVTIVNSGISGSTTRDSLKRLQRDVLNHKPDLTFIMLGINDSSSWFNVGFEEFQSNYRKIIKQVQESGSEIILMTQNEFKDNPYDGKVTFTKYPQYEKKILDIGKEYNIPVIDNYKYWQKLKNKNKELFNSLMSDWVHPNDKGHIFFYSIMRKHIIQLLKLDESVWEKDLIE